MTARKPIRRKSEPAGAATSDGFLRGHQVARILGIAIPLTMILVWWGTWGSHGKVKSVSETTAIVIRVDEHTCVVRVVSGEQVRVFRPLNVREGMKIPMTRTEYGNGELRFDVISR